MLPFPDFFWKLATKDNMIELSPPVNVFPGIWRKLPDYHLHIFIPAAV
jgi:hypothetical protein